MADVQTPTSLTEAVLYFSDPDRCLDYVVSRRWPDGVRCPSCGSTKVTFLKNQRRWKCSQKHDKRQFSAKVGTIFEDSPLGFEKWLPAMWLLANCKNGISSYELADGIKVQQRTAWFMLQRIRLAMQESGGILGGPGGVVEIDETWIGGKARLMNRKQRAKTKATSPGGPYGFGGKAIVMAMLERGGRVATKVVPNVQAATLVPTIKERVARGAEVHTDQHSGYASLSGRTYDQFLAGEEPYEHKTVDHAVEYVRDNVHVNGVENFWSLLKRTLGGTYVSVEPFHLFRYLDEQAYRFNARKATSAERFAGAVDAVAGKRLTYKELTGATPAS